MKFKLGTASYAYLWKTTIEDAIEEIARHGFHYLELMTTAPHLSPATGPWERKLIRRLLDSHGIQLLSVNPTFLDTNLISLNEDFRRLSISNIKKNIQLTSDLGGSIVVLIPGRRQGLIPAPYNISLEVAKESITECLEEAARCNMIIGLENAPSCFIETGEQVAQLVREINHSNLKIVFDVANAFMVEPVVEGLTKVKDHLALVHLSDTTRDKWGHLPVGVGSVDFYEVSQFLQQISYQGVSILEITAARDLEEGLIRSIDSLEKMNWSR
ncbi:MAG: sugar phosphate isomerase/epimerase [Firmicutes bacterium]|nr:sugar phosphate isomerase/epimerase [Bacillota bacterium]